MTDDMEGLKRRLVVGHKSDGRNVYDEAAKSELVALCLRPGASVSRLARECGVNANQVSRWLREHGHVSRPRRVATDVVPTMTSAFMAVPLESALPATPDGGQRNAAMMDVQARLPNGVAVELCGVSLRHVGEVLEALGRLRCSASTKG